MTTTTMTIVANMNQRPQFHLCLATTTNTTTTAKHKPQLNGKCNFEDTKLNPKPQHNTEDEDNEEDEKKEQQNQLMPPNIDHSKAQQLQDNKIDKLSSLLPSQAKNKILEPLTLTEKRRKLALLHKHSSPILPNTNASHKISETVEQAQQACQNQLPSLVLPYLYVGNLEDTQIDIISKLNISYILSLQSLPKFLLASAHLLPSENTSKDYLVNVGKLIRGKCINVSDSLEQLVENFFDESQAFIEEARRNKCNILIHCRAGISRAPTIAIAYLMKLKKWRFKDAYQFVQKSRPQISPNFNFLGQLVNYEQTLKVNEDL